MLGADKTKRLRKRSRATPVKVRDAIRLMVLDGHTSPSAIYHALQLDAELAAISLPSKWTVAREVEDALRELGEDLSGPWSATDSSDSQNLSSPILLAVLADVIERTEGRIQTITRAEAAGLARLARLVPDLPPIDLWRLSRVYAGRQAEGASTADLDAYLAFAPWRTIEASDRYEKAVTSGWVAPIPQLVSMMLDGGYNRHPASRAERIDDLDRVERAVREGRPIEAPGWMVDIAGQPPRAGASSPAPGRARSRSGSAGSHGA